MARLSASASALLKVDTKYGISDGFGTDKRLEADVRDVREATDLPAMPSVKLRQTARPAHRPALVSVRRRE